MNEDVPLENPLGNAGSGTAGGSVPQWTAAKQAAKGDLIRPVNLPSPTATAPINGNFTAGNTGWDLEGGAHIVSGKLELPGRISDGAAVNQARFVVADGASLTANCLIEQGAAKAGATRGWVEVRWYDKDDVMISYAQGNIVSSDAAISTVVSPKPAGASYARAVVALWSVGDHDHVTFADNLTVSGAVNGLPAGLVYRAVQDVLAHTGATEPAWPMAG